MAGENFEEAVELDKKAAKKATKAKKKEEKKSKKLAKKEAKKNGTELEDEESGGKVAIVLVTLVIILIWLAILAVLIRFDVGGFGSTVMQPILKDVPYLNKILPETEEAQKEKEDEYPYKSLDEAMAYIKELEKKLADAKESNSKDSAYVADLEAQVAQWQEYKNNEAKFEEEKAKYYQEVVFSDKAPDISEYKKYYESINPANAEALYKQVVEQQQEDADLEDYVKTYSQMKPRQAAEIFDTMTNDLKLVARILSAMKADARGDILGNMNKDTAARITKLMEP
ncbi:MAG: hypothetical protein HFI37_03985 [Lachnospiraceae bacterium]|nr:hypothetical protein [Lachnospiraceae bacterium]